jgi:hypothetical protein
VIALISIVIVGRNTSTLAESNTPPQFVTAQYLKRPEGYWNLVHEAQGFKEELGNAKDYEGSVLLEWQESSSSVVRNGDWYTVEICGSDTCKTVLTSVDSVYGTNAPGMTAPSTTAPPDEASWTAQQQVGARIFVPTGIVGKQLTFRVARNASADAANFDFTCLTWGETWARDLCNDFPRVESASLQWSSPTPPVDRYADFAPPADSTLAPMEIAISHANPAPNDRTGSISFSFCLNRTDDKYTSFFDGWVPKFPMPYLRIIGPRATWKVTSTGLAEQSGEVADLVNKTSALDGDREPGAGRSLTAEFCETTTDGISRWYGNTKIDQLEPGRKYTLTVELNSESHPSFIGTVDFVVPGGCPTETINSSPRLIPYRFYVINNEGRLARVPMIAYEGLPNEWIGKRIAPVYYSPFKTFPTSSKYEYLPAVDDWALHLDATTIGNASIQKRTIFSDCSPEEVKMLVEVRKNPISGGETESACRLVEGEVQVTRVGICTLRVIISPALNVSKSSLANPHQADLYYIIDNLKSNTVTTTTTPVLIAKNKSLTVGKSLSAKQLSTLYKLPADGRYTVVANSSGRTCRAVRGRVVPLRRGTCTLVLTEKKKALSYIVKIVVKRP